MKFSVTVPQLFYDFIARILPGFLFLVALQECLAGTVFDPASTSVAQHLTGVGSLMKGLALTALCYFFGWMLRSIRWPNLQPEETSPFRTKYQRIRLRHPESGFRLVKLRAEARLLEASRAGLFVVSGITFVCWAFSETKLVAGSSSTASLWTLRISLPILIGLLFLRQEKTMWSAYRGNVKKIHALIFDEDMLANDAEPSNSSDEPNGRPCRAAGGGEASG